MKEEATEAIITLIAELKAHYPMFTNEEYINIVQDAVDEFELGLCGFDVEECLN